MMATLDEILQNHNDRLVEADGRIFALTHLVRELLKLSVAEQHEVNSLLQNCIDDMTPVGTVDDPDDPDDQKFTEAARSLFGELIAGTPPTRPTFPSLTLIRGGKETS
jgi:hypothetical protein